jgi:hypothetical protein
VNLLGTAGAGLRSQDAGGCPERWTAADRPAYGEVVRAVSLLLLCRDEA